MNDSSPNNIRDILDKAAVVDKHLDQVVLEENLEKLNSDLTDVIITADEFVERVKDND